MSDFNVTVNNSLEFFGPAPSNKWNNHLWGAFLWGEGNEDLQTLVNKVIANSLAFDSSVFSYIDLVQYVENTLSLDGDMYGEFLEDGSDYDYVFASNVIDGERRTFPTYSTVASALSTYILQSLGATTYSSSSGSSPTYEEETLYYGDFEMSNIRLTKTTEPSTPSAGKVVIWWDTEEMLKAKDEFGNISEIGPLDLASSMALVTDAQGVITVSAVTAAELGFLSGVTSAVQTQINNKTTGVSTSVDGEIALFSGTGGKTLRRADQTGFAKVTNGVLDNVLRTYVKLSAGDSEVDGILPIANGGTGTSSLSGNNRVVCTSSGGGFTTASAIAGLRVLGSNLSGIPTHTTITVSNFQTYFAPLTTLDSAGQNADGQGFLIRNADDSMQLGYFVAGDGLEIVEADGTGTGGTITYGVNFAGWWDQVINVSSDVTLTNRALHLVDTSAARTLTLPGAIAFGDRPYIVVKDATGSAASNNITIARNGGTIDGAAANYTINTNGGSILLTTDGTNNAYYILAKF